LKKREIELQDFQRVEAKDPSILLASEESELPQKELKKENYLSNSQLLERPQLPKIKILEEDEEEMGSDTDTVTGRSFMQQNYVMKPEAEHLPFQIEETIHSDDEELSD